MKYSRGKWDISQENSQLICSSMQHATVLNMAYTSAHGYNSFDSCVLCDEAFGQGETWVEFRPWQNEDTLWGQHCVCGKTWQHCCAPCTRKKSFWRFSETFLCSPQMFHAWQNEPTFGKCDHVSMMLPPYCVLILPRPYSATSLKHCILMLTSKLLVGINPKLTSTQLSNLLFKAFLSWCCK